MKATTPWEPGPLSKLFHLGLLLIILGAIVFLVSMGAFILLWIYGIKVVGPYQGNVTFYGVAPEFIEAVRVRRQEMIKTLADLAGGNASLGLVEGAIQQGPLAEETLRALSLARQAALSFRHDHIGTEHLLLGLRTAIPCLAAYILKSHGVESEILQNGLRKINSSGGDDNKEPPPTPRLKKIIGYAFEETRNQKSLLMDTSHLLLGLLREEDSIALEMLLDLGINLENLRNEIMKPIASSDHSDLPPAPGPARNS